MKHHISYFYNALLEYYQLHQAEWQTRWHNPLDWGLVSFVATCLELWSVIRQRVYETRVHNIDELRQRLLLVWRGLEQSLIDDIDSVDQWRMLACLCSCQWRTFWTYFVIINFSLYLMTFMFDTVLDVACIILRVHYKSMKCDVSFSLGCVSTLLGEVDIFVTYMCV